MSVWFAIRSYGYDGDEVYGPFTTSDVATDFIEKGECSNRHSPWWTDFWYLVEAEVANEWQKGNDLSRCSGKAYRPFYCEEMRRRRDEQYRREHPEESATWDRIGNAIKGMSENRRSVKDILSDLQYGREIQVVIEKESDNDV